MRRMTTWCGVTATLVLALGLGACKSSNKRCTDCAPSTPAPLAYTEFPADSPSYPPPPMIPEQSGPTSAQLAAAQDQAMLESQRRQDAEAQLRLEQQRADDAQRALEAERRRLVDRQNATPPAPVRETPIMPEVDRVEMLVADLRARSNAEIIREGDMVIMRITNGFKAGSDLLKTDVQLITALNAAADALERHDGASVAVVGHTDGDQIKISKWKSNDELSLARAQRVASVLSSNGVNPDRISIDGRGSREPLASPERNATDKARNRRVEIMIHL